MFGIWLNIFRLIWRKRVTRYQDGYMTSSYLRKKIIILHVLLKTICTEAVWKLSALRKSLIQDLLMRLLKKRKIRFYLKNLTMYGRATLTKWQAIMLLLCRLKISTGYIIIIRATATSLILSELWWKIHTAKKQQDI